MKLFKLFLFSLLIFAFFSFKTNYTQKLELNTSFKNETTLPLRDAVIIVKHKKGLSTSEINQLLSCVSSRYGILFEFKTFNNIPNTLTWKVKYDPDHHNNYLISRPGTVGLDTECENALAGDCDTDEDIDKPSLCDNLVSIEFIIGPKSN